MVESAHPYEAKARIIEGNEREEKTSSTSECVNKSLEKHSKALCSQVTSQVHYAPFASVLAQVWHLLALDCPALDDGEILTVAKCIPTTCRRGAEVARGSGGVLGTVAREGRGQTQALGGHPE